MSKSIGATGYYGISDDPELCPEPTLGNSHAR